MQDIPDIRNYLNLMSFKDFRVFVAEDELTTPKEWQKLQKDFKQNAFDAGYITIDKMVRKDEGNGTITNEISLKIPNLEIFQSFQKLLRDFLVGNDKLGFISECLRERKFKQLLLDIETVAFRDKTFLNLYDKADNIRRFADKEILLHYIIAMTLELSLSEEEKKSLITHYILENDKALANKKS